MIHGGGGSGTIGLTPRIPGGEIKIEGNAQRPAGGSTIVIQGGAEFGAIDLTPRTYHGEIRIEGNTQRPPVYDGPTTVIPEPFEAQVLQTENRIVEENILVMPIPYFETSNPQGGTTVYIGQ